jgi:hypothetical protein
MIDEISQKTHELCTKVENLLPHSLDSGHPVVYGSGQDRHEVGVPRMSRVPKEARLIHRRVRISFVTGDAVKMKKNIFTK